MKHFFLFIFLLATISTQAAHAKKDPVVQIRASDFLIMYLNSQLAKNPTLNQKDGWGLHFVLEQGKDKPLVKAVGGYFESSQMQELEKAAKTGELFFDDLVRRYNLKGKFDWKIEISKAAIK